MKRTIVLFALIAVIVTAVIAVNHTNLSAATDNGAKISQTVTQDKNATCCQIFRVLKAGRPIKNCTVYIDASLSWYGITDGNGECTICGFTEGETHTAYPSCCPDVAVEFQACTNVIVVDINCQ